MILLRLRHFWQTKRLYVVGILACFCVLGLAPVGYGKTDRVTQLIVQLKDPDHGLRQTAAQELGEIKDPRGVEPLIAALNDTDWRVRWYAAQALGELKDPRAIESLRVAMMKDPDSDVRQRMTTSLDEIKATPSASSLRTSTCSIRSGGTPKSAAAIESNETAAEQAAWKRAVASNSVGGFLTYYKKFPDTKKVVVYEGTLKTEIDARSSLVTPSGGSLSFEVSVRMNGVDVCIMPVAEAMQWKIGKIVNQPVAGGSTKALQGALIPNARIVMLTGPDKVISIDWKPTGPMEP